ncbi:MAG: hypothetical protein Greene041662_371 [Candidatus Peregrinibacteria bacterium Greene0416_62]|nr:MAG: hypothetical protein Greene041662_371 [Candidatus Peregrinibacteria bacterium Greene0416_62]TSC99132.1 MAG: hypothetical protein Greene101449_708 [Candidatus Peregrinibacteria bacterium Greene1014_49]
MEGGDGSPRFPSISLKGTLCAPLHQFSRANSEEAERSQQRPLRGLSSETQNMRRSIGGEQVHINYAPVCSFSNVCLKHSF